MTVSLQWITPEAEKMIMKIARVSNPANQDSTNTKLLEYCAKHGHWSIFEMASMCVEINCSRTIARQILRHRSFSFQEFSQRYADVTQMKSDLVISAARSQDHKNRQASHDDMNQETKDWFNQIQQTNWDIALNDYKMALDKGIAKECARVLLPEGLTPSRMYMTGSIRSWIHYLTLRTGNGTQLEHQVIAKGILDIFKTELPTIYNSIQWESL